MHTVIYIPGLADKLHYVIGQRTALFFWRARKLRVQYFVVNWVNKEESFDSKLKRLLAAIDQAAAHGSVSLVAASAGSSIGLVAFYKRRHVIEAFVSICGKIRKPTTIPKPLVALNPSFYEAVQQAEHFEPKLSDADRARILIINATQDSYVPKGDGSVAGAKQRTLPSVGHVTTIMSAITWHRMPIIRYLQSKR